MKNKMSRLVRDIYIYKLRKIVMKGRSVGATTLAIEYEKTLPGKLLEELILLKKLSLQVENYNARIC